MEPAEPSAPGPSPEPVRRRWFAPKAFGGRRLAGWQAFLVAGGLLVAVLLVAVLVRGRGFSPALIMVVPLILVLAIGILVKR